MPSGPLRPTRCGTRCTPTVRRGRSRPSRRSSRCTRACRCTTRRWGSVSPTARSPGCASTPTPPTMTRVSSTGATTIFNDITDIFEQATSQQASQRRFLTTFERSPVGSLIVGPDGTLLAANLAFATLIGRPVTEIVAIDRFALAELGISMHLFIALTSPRAQRYERGVVRVPTSRRRGPLRPDPDLRDRMAGLRSVLDGPSRRHDGVGTVADRARAQRQPLPGDVRFVTDRADDLRARRCRQACQPGDGSAPRPAGGADRRVVGRRFHPPRGTAPGEAVRGQGDESLGRRRGSSHRATRRRDPLVARPRDADRHRRGPGVARPGGRPHRRPSTRRPEPVDRPADGSADPRPSDLDARGSRVLARRVG